MPGPVIRSRQFCIGWRQPSTLDANSSEFPRRSTTGARNFKAMTRRTQRVRRGVRGTRARPRILVGTDFSPAAEHALECAAELAAQIGASLACVHAYEDSAGATLREEPPTWVLPRLQETATQLIARFPGAHVECFVRRGAPWDELANLAGELKAEMIVVGASGEHERPKGAFLGSVAERVATCSRCPVLIVSSRDSEPFTRT